jgi:hypothetical protein
MAKEMTDSTPTLKSYNSIEEILLDKDLASLGDSYVNFVYSLAMSKKCGRPTGAKVNNRILATAVDASGLRKFLPRRVDRHNRGNAAEALLVLAWLQDLLEMEDCIKVLTEKEDVAKAFAILLRQAMDKLGVNHEHK